MTNIADRLREVDKSWNVATISQEIMNILRENPGVNLLDIEDHFRTLDSKTTYLVAWPREMIPPLSDTNFFSQTLQAQEQKVIPRNMKGEEMPYGLWLCINGLDDMIHQLQAFGLTREQNRNALPQTGFNTIEDEDAKNRDA